MRVIREKATQTVVVNYDFDDGSSVEVCHKCYRDGAGEHRCDEAMTLTPAGYNTGMPFDPDLHETHKAAIDAHQQEKVPEGLRRLKEGLESALAEAKKQSEKALAEVDKERDEHLARLRRSTNLTYAAVIAIATIGMAVIVVSTLRQPATIESTATSSTANSTEGE